MNKAIALLIILLATQLSYSQPTDSPLIEINPDSLSENLLTGGTSDQLLTITNTGDETLSFEASIVYFSNEDDQNYALKFDGQNDYVDVGEDINIANGSFTLEFWVKRSSVYDWHNIIGQGTYYTSVGLHTGFRENDVFTFAFYDNDLDTPESYTDLNWHHWACTYDATSQERRILRDGAEVASDIAPENYLGTGTMFLGMSPWYNSHLHGTLDDVRIWEVVRTPQDIQQNKNWELLGSEPGLIAYWKLNEGDGSTAYDETGNSNNGALFYDPEWVISDAPVYPRQWLSLQPDSGQVDPGNASDMEISFDANGLSGGSYYAEITIVCNDPLNPELIIPVNLDIISAADMLVSTDSLNFGSVFIGDSIPLPLLISNVGFDTLVITGISCFYPEFLIGSPSLLLMPGESHELAVTFIPSNDILYESDLKIESNDPYQPLVTIHLSGTGLLPPIFTLEPDSLMDTLYSGKSSTQTFAISNTGYNDLTWEVILDNEGFNTITFVKENYADWTDPANQDCITPNVCITRANTQGIFNVKTESSYGEYSPDDTEWAFGYTSQLQPEDYHYWAEAVGWSPPSMVDQPMSVHLLSDDIYVDIMFHSWTSGWNGGGFSYTRSVKFPFWLDLFQQDGVIPAGSSAEIEVAYDASLLNGGTHNGMLAIGTNDPLSPIVHLPVLLEVIDGPAISPAEDTIDFGVIFIGYPDTLTLVVENKGSTDLLIVSAESGQDEFEVYPAFAGIDPGEMEVFHISYSPGIETADTGNLIFTSNDPLIPTSEIILTGHGLEPPVTTVFPDSFSIDLLSNQTVCETFTIQNSGGSDLDMTVSPAATDQNTYLVFDGMNDYVTLGSVPLANSSFTLEAWAKRSVIGDWHNIFGLGGSYSDHGLHVGFRENNTFTFAFYNNDLNTSDQYTDTCWHHWACTFDLSSLERKIFRDGVEVASDVASEDFQGSGAMYIGSAPWSAIVFEGSLEEVRIWDTPRSQQEIYQYKSIELQGNEPGLIGYWDFNEGEGLTVLDKTYTANHGTLQNGVTWSDFQSPVSPFWLSVFPNECVIPSGSSLDIQAIFNTENMTGYQYYSSIFLESNDPAKNEIQIPVFMHVSGVPLISTDCEVLECGQVFITYTDSVLLEVKNLGSDKLIIENVLAEPDDFTVFPSQADIDPGMSTIFTVVFSPTIAEEYIGTLTFYCNDTLQNEYQVILKGEGLAPPIISVTPDLMFQQLDPGETASQVLTIYNTGGSALFYSSSPPHNRSLQFDGEDDCCMVFDSPSLDIGTNEVTLELWVKLFELPSNIAGGFAGIYDSDDDSYVIYEDKDNEELRFKITDYNSTNERPGISEEDLLINTWYHIAGVYDGEIKQARIYLNGEEKDMHYNVGLDHVVLPGQVATFGSEAGLSRFFNGIVDECRVWSVARTQEEILEFMNKELTGSEPNLVACWKFNEGTGIKTYDLTQNGNDGTLINGPTWIDSGAPLEGSWLTITPDTGSCLQGTSQELQITFNSENLDPGDYFYDMMILSNDPVSPQVIIPVHLEVLGNTGNNSAEANIPFSIYPNPCSGAAHLRVSNSNLWDPFGKQQTIKFEVFTISGIKIKELLMEEMAPGPYEMEIDLTDLPAGVYYCVLKTNNETYTTKLIIL